MWEPCYFFLFFFYLFLFTRCDLWDGKSNWFWLECIIIIWIVFWLKANIFNGESILLGWIRRRMEWSTSRMWNTPAEKKTVCSLYVSRSLVKLQAINKWPERTIDRRVVFDMLNNLTWALGHVKSHTYLKFTKCVNWCSKQTDNR